MNIDIMTSQEAAKYLRIGVVTLKRKAQEGSIPAAKIGRVWRFQKKHLDAWLDAGGDLPEALVDWALTEMVKERSANKKDDWISIDQVKKELGV